MVRKQQYSHWLLVCTLALPLAAQTVSINPSTTNLRIDATKQFTSSVTGATNTAVTWSVPGSGNGSVSTTGLYTPPAVLPANPVIKVRATSVANNTKFAEATVNLQNPIPTIATIEPTEFNIGNYRLIVKGTKYVAGATIKLQGTAITTSFVSSTELQADVSFPTAQQYCVIVNNPAPGGGDSAQKCFTVMAPVSVTVSPTTSTVRGGATRQYTATVKNTATKDVNWMVNGVVGGNATTGTIATDGTFTAPLNIAAVGGTVKIGAQSKKDPNAKAEVTVTLQNPVPTISGVNPTSIPPGPATFTINGNGFAAGATVNLAGVAMTANVISLTQIQVTGTAKAVPGGVAALTVSNPAPGPTTSAPALVTISPANPKVSYTAAKRFLEQASWGASADEIYRVMGMGFDAWLEEQKNLVESDYTMPTPNGNIPVYDMQSEFFNNAMTKRDQLRQRVAFTLHQIFVVSAVQLDNTKALVPYHKTLLRNALGNYRTLMREITLDVGMGQYLNMLNNDKANPAKGLEPNENYSREVMQLFTLGTQILRADGSLLRDANGNPYNTYTQSDITELARVFTGWTYPAGRGKTTNNHNNENYGDPMVAVESNHDTGSKKVLGITFPAGQTAAQDLDTAMNTLFEHPNIGPFVALRLIQHHVTSNPSAGYLMRVIQAFNNTGGKRGDLYGTMRAVLLDPEARAGDNPTAPNPYASFAGHLREPVLYIINVLKALDATVVRDNPIESDIENMGQKVFYSPSVFNYYSPLSRVPGTPALYGPEYQLLTPVNALERVNYIDYLLKLDPNAEAKLNIDAFVALGGNVDALIAAINNHLMNGVMPDVLKQGIKDTLAQTTDPKVRARMALYLALTSGFYQVQN